MSDIQVKAARAMMTMKRVRYDERPTFALDENCEKEKKQQDT